MRASIIVALCLVSLSGCAEMAYPEYSPTLTPDGNVTLAPSPPADNTSTVTEPAAPLYPIVTTVPTTPYTAPASIDLGRHEENGAVLRLVASHEGLACDGGTTQDLYAAPAGYKVTDAWTTCALSADNATFAQARGDGLLPLMADIPVDTFTWEMAIHRTLVNNTGSHDEILAEVSAPMLAAPSVVASVDHHRGEICDGNDAREASQGPMGVETVRLTAQAHNGRALVEIPVADLQVLNVSSTSPFTWDNDTIQVTGAWGHYSDISVDVTIDFEAEGEYITLLPGCMGRAFQADFIEIPFEATAQGIGAGWHAADPGAFYADVYLQTL